MDITPLLQMAFYIILIIYTIFSAVLFYHWQNYALSRSATVHTYIAYGTVSLPLLLVMAVIAFGA